MEEVIDKDSRPFFPKAPGEMGIYIDFLDVEPINKQEYGSPHYMRMDFLDKLFEELSKIQLFVIKGALERKGLMDGVIMEKCHKGVVLGMSFDSHGALDQAWNQYEQGKVAPVIIKFLNTPELLNSIGAKSIKLRAQMWRDEYDACRLEMENIRLKSFSLKDKEYDQEMMREVKQFAKAKLHALATELKDNYAAMDNSFSQMTMALKKNMPIKVTKIPNFQQFQTHFKTIQTSKRAQTKPFDDYINLRKKIFDALDTVEANICHRLGQVHAHCETNNQNDLKYTIRTECAHAKERLTDDYDWSHLKHPEWQKKILRRDHAFFLGMASVIGAGMDTLLEIDIQVDEYLSGVDGVKI